MTHIVTAITGGKDRPKTHKTQTVDCTYTVIGDELGDPNVSPVRRAKAPKLRPWDYTDSDDPWIWVDGSVEITSETFVADVVDGGPLSMWSHPDRDCIYTEASKCSRFPKARQQAESYRALGHPENWGLWAAGVIVYRQRLDDLADAWQAEIDQWSERDQISLPYVLRRLGMRPDPLPGTIYENRWLKVHGHSRRR